VTASLAALLLLLLFVLLMLLLLLLLPLALLQTELEVQVEELVLVGEIDEGQSEQEAEWRRQYQEQLPAAKKHEAGFAWLLLLVGFI